MVNQKTKIIELTNEYSVFDAAGKQLGAVRQTGQSTLKKALRLVSSVDQFMTHTLEVTDATGVTQLTLTRPRKVFKSTIVVARPDGTDALCRHRSEAGQARLQLTERRPERGSP